MSGVPSILWHYARTRHGGHFGDRAQLETWQDRQVQRLLTRVLPRSPFYLHHYQGLDPANWRQFPLIDKSLMMANFAGLNTKGIEAAAAMAIALEAERSRDFSPTLGSLTVGLSSGTSGNRGLFLVSPQERHAWAGCVLAKLLPGSILDAHRIAFFLRANSNLYASVSSRRIRFAFFDLLEQVEAHVTRLNEFQPTMLVAPPSMLRFLAAAAERGRLRIAPARVVSVAEVLDPLDEAYVSRHFHQRLHQVYQCTEGFLAVTCAHGTLHLNEDLVAVQPEWVDEARGKFVPILTDFRRLTQPILRYRLNDILTERREPCPCGSVFRALERIEGRCDDVFYLPGHDGTVRAIFPDFIRRAIMTAAAEIEEYRAVQRGPLELEVAFRAPEDLRAGIELRLAAGFQELWQRLEAQDPRLSFVPYHHEAGAQKLRRVRRAFTPAETLF